jgi:hypothetical protein
MVTQFKFKNVGNNKLLICLFFTLLSVKKIDLNPDAFNDAQPSDWYECFTQIIEKTNKVKDENNKIRNDI